MFFLGIIYIPFEYIIFKNKNKDENNKYYPLKTLLDKRLRVNE